MPEGTKFQILAPVIRMRKGELIDPFERLASEGYACVIVDDEMYHLTDPPRLKKQVRHDADVVIDRFQMKEPQ